MAELSVGKGRDAVARIEGAGHQPGGLSRPQVSPPPRTDERRRREGEEGTEVVEIGEEARKQGEAEAAAGAAQESEAEPEKDKAQGAIVDVVV